MNKKNGIILTIVLLVIICTAIFAVTTRQNGKKFQDNTKENTAIIQKADKKADFDCQKICNRRNSNGIPPCKRRAMHRNHGTGPLGKTSN